METLRSYRAPYTATLPFDWDGVLSASALSRTERVRRSTPIGAGALGSRPAT